MATKAVASLLNEIPAASDKIGLGKTWHDSKARLQIPDSFSHLDMTGSGQAAEPLTVSLSSFAAFLQTQNQTVCKDLHPFHVAK